MSYCEIYLDICSNSKFEKNLREGGARNVHREDKKMRGHSNVTMCEWLINSFFTFLRLGDLHLVGPEGEDADIQIQEDVSVCLRGTTTLF